MEWKFQGAESCKFILVLCTVLNCPKLKMMILTDKRNVGKRLHHGMTWPWWLLNEVWKWNVQWSSPPLSFVLCDTPTHIHLTWKGETEVSEDYLIIRIPGQAQCEP